MINCAPAWEEVIPFGGIEQCADHVFAQHGGKKELPESTEVYLATWEPCSEVPLSMTVQDCNHADHAGNKTIQYG
jgi:hypothetical protein